MEKDLITLEASSPEELTEVLQKLSRADTRGCLYCALAVSDREFLVYPFNFKETSRVDAIKQVLAEVAAIYELPLGRIDYDFQIFDEEENCISGVCAAVPKERLSRYLDILDAHRFVPLRIIPYCSTIIDYYFHLHHDPTARFAVVDLSKKYTVGLAVFKNNRCRLMRQIPYERLHEVVPEITASLKNACVVSGFEQPDRIHFAGTLEDKMDILREIESAFQAKTERDHSVDVMTALSLEDRYSTIDLARGYTFSERGRTKVAHLTFLVMGLCGLALLYLSSEVLLKVWRLKKLNASYTLTEYDYARNLKQEMDAL